MSILRLKQKRISLRFITCMLLACTSCRVGSEYDTDIEKSSKGIPLVQSIEHTEYTGDDSKSYIARYDYEHGKIVNRMETSVDSGESHTYDYTYSDNNISNVDIFSIDSTLESELSFHYDEDGQIVSFYQQNYDEGVLSTSWQATFSYENNRILHCDGQSWSSVEYKDVYEHVYIYTTNQNGDIVHIETVEDCYFSAIVVSTGEDMTLEYDDTIAPFSNVEGNNVILSSIIGVFTNSEVLGFHNNAMKKTDHSESNAIQTWLLDDNEAGYPQTIQWVFNEEIREDISIEYE